MASLVRRLLEGAAPVIAITGGYGDGKTSILNLLREALPAEKGIVVNFKTSLPGDDLTLASTLFNSLRKELHRHFFVRRLGNILRKLARKFSGLVPSAPSGLKELFAEASQEAELSDLTTVLETLANRFGDTHEITQILKDIITRSSTDAFAYRVFGFATNQERNKIFESWENVIKDEIEAAFLQRLKAKYHKGADQSIYTPGTNFRDWQALVSWSRHSDKDAEDVSAYLEDEFERRPASIGKHIHWLWSTVASPDGKKLVDRLFPLPKLAELARMRGPKAYSTEHEKKTVQALIQGDWPVG